MTKDKIHMMRGTFSKQKKRARLHRPLLLMLQVMYQTPVRASEETSRIPSMDLPSSFLIQRPAATSLESLSKDSNLQQMPP